MRRCIRTGAIYAGTFAYGALWIALVLTREMPLSPERAARWPLSAALLPVWIGVLWAAGWALAGQRVTSSPTWAVIAAMVTVATMLYLVSAWRAVLWGGPPGLRWAVAGLAVVATILASGRAKGWAMVGGAIWSGLGVFWWGELAWGDRIDALLTTLLVGTALGALGGTLLSRPRSPR
jgi:hypothetical protein